MVIAIVIQRGKQAKLMISSLSFSIIFFFFFLRRRSINKANISSSSFTWHSIHSFSSIHPFIRSFMQASRHSNQRTRMCRAKNNSYAMPERGHLDNVQWHKNSMLHQWSSGAEWWFSIEHRVRVRLSHASLLAQDITIGSRFSVWPRVVVCCP